MPSSADRPRRSQAIEAAERAGGKDYKVLLVTADDLRMLGHRDQAMTRYERALEGSDENRLQVRLALARLFADEGHSAEAQQQVALGFAEARVAATDVTSAEDYLNAADVLMSIHEYPLAQRMYGRAQALGADDTTVAVGMANASLALGDTRSAQLQLASLGDDAERKNNYEFLVAQGNVYRQLGEIDRALANFVHANQLDPQDQATRATEMELAEEEGRPIIDRLGMGSDVRVNPVFEDENIYQMDARLLGVQNNGALLPPPRRTIETFADSRFQFRPDSFPPIQGFIAERNAQGALSFPSQLLIQDRNTFDTIFNISVAPIVRLGGIKLNLMPGIQYTSPPRHAFPAVHESESVSPIRLCRQQLDRQLALVFRRFDSRGRSIHGRESALAGLFRCCRFSPGPTLGPERPVDRVQRARPAVRTRRVRVLPDCFLCRPAAWVRFPHPRMAVAEFLRAWRVQGNSYAIAQTLRPRFGIDAQFKEHWTLSASGAWSSGRSFHAYDNVTSSVMFTYTHERNLNRSLGSETASLAYPLRFSFGFEQQSFYDFPGQGGNKFVPAAQFTF